MVISAVEIEFDMHRSETNEDVSREQYEFEHFVALAAARGACSICLIPLEYARTRLANDIKCVESGCQRQFKGLRDVFRKTLKSDGVLGVYRGISFAYIGLLVYDFFSFPSIRKLEQDLYKVSRIIMMLLFSCYYQHFFMFSQIHSALQHSGDVTDFKL